MLTFNYRIALYSGVERTSISPAEEDPLVQSWHTALESKSSQIL
jgi:hypothetical protein